MFGPTRLRVAALSSVGAFVDTSHDASARVVDIFQDHIVRFENTVCWRWARATSFTEQREMHRVMIDGDIPLNVHGRRSVTRVKRPNPELQQAAE